MAQVTLSLPAPERRISPTVFCFMGRTEGHQSWKHCQPFGLMAGYCASTDEPYVSFTNTSGEQDFAGCDPANAASAAGDGQPQHVRAAAQHDAWEGYGSLPSSLRAPTLPDLTIIGPDFQRPDDLETATEPYQFGNCPSTQDATQPTSNGTSVRAFGGWLSDFNGLTDAQQAGVTLILDDGQAPPNQDGDPEDLEAEGSFSEPTGFVARFGNPEDLDCRGLAVGAHRPTGTRTTTPAPVEALIARTAPSPSRPAPQSVEDREGDPRGLGRRGIVRGAHRHSLRQPTDNTGFPEPLTAHGFFREPTGFNPTPAASTWRPRRFSPASGPRTATGRTSPPPTGLGRLRGSALRGRGPHHLAPPVQPETPRTRRLRHRLDVRDSRALGSDHHVSLPGGRMVLRRAERRALPQHPDDHQRRPRDLERVGKVLTCPETPKL